MRSLLLLTVLPLFIMRSASAQELAMPNGSFEHWHSVGGFYYVPDFWTTNNTTLFTGVVRDSIYHLDSAYSMRVLTNGVATSPMMEPLVSRIMYRYFCSITTKDSVVLKLLEYRHRELVDSNIVIHRTGTPNWTLGYLPIKDLFDSVKLLVIGGRMAGTVFNIDRAVYYALGTGVEQNVSIIRASVSPNPMNSTCILRFDNAEHRAYRWILTNAVGQIMRSQDEVRTAEISIGRGSLAPGIYSWHLWSQEYNGQATGKLLIE